jgi:hypothetical protein
MRKERKEEQIKHGNSTHHIPLPFSLILRDRRQIGQIRNILKVRNIAEAKGYEITRKLLNIITKGKTLTFIKCTKSYMQEIQQIT